MNCINCGFYPCGCAGGLGAGYAVQSTTYAQPGLAQTVYTQPGLVGYAQPTVSLGMPGYVDTATYTSAPLIGGTTTTTYTTGTTYGAGIGGIGYGMCATCGSAPGVCLCPRIY